MRTALIALIIAMTSAPALAESRDYGLWQTEVNGVVVTRGKAYEPDRTFKKTERRKTVVNLDRNYRGSVFGKHRIIRGGRIFYREQLLPIRQRGDE